MGSVGLSAIVPALSALGHEVLAVPTVVLSNHPGHAFTAGLRMPPDQVSALVAALDGNGWLAGLDAVLTGYLPTREHVEAAAEVLDRVAAASPSAVYVCDPVLGDDPKGLYIEAEAAAAIGRLLLPRALLATPNRFELAYLTGRKVETISDAMRALMCLPCGGGIATSIPAVGIPGREPEELANVVAQDTVLASTRVPRQPDTPHGTGDLFAALVVHAVVCRLGLEDALSFATAGVEAALAGAEAKAKGLLNLPASARPGERAQPLAWPVERWSARR